MIATQRTVMWLRDDKLDITRHLLQQELWDALNTIIN